MFQDHIQLQWYKPTIIVVQLIIVSWYFQNMNKQKIDKICWYTFKPSAMEFFLFNIIGLMSSAL